MRLFSFSGRSLAMGALFTSVAAHLLVAQTFMRWPAAPAPVAIDSLSILIALAPPSMNTAPNEEQVVPVQAPQPVAMQEPAPPPVPEPVDPTPAPPEPKTLPQEPPPPPLAPEPVEPLVPPVEPTIDPVPEVVQEPPPPPPKPKEVKPEKPPVAKPKRPIRPAVREVSEEVAFVPDTPPVLTQIDPRLAIAQLGRAVKDYRATIRAMLSDAKRYPAAARRLHVQGLVVIEYNIDPRGRASDVDVVKSSGHRILDQETIRLVKNSSPYPPPPGGWIHLRFPFHYSLTTSRGKRLPVRNSSYD